MVSQPCIRHRAVKQLRSAGAVPQSITSAEFRDDRNRYIWETMQQLAVDKKRVSTLSVIDFLEAHGEIEKAGGRFYVTELVTP